MGVIPCPHTHSYAFFPMLFFLVELAILNINKCVVSGDAEPEAMVAALSNEFAQLESSSIDSTCGARYHVALRQAREEKGGEDLSLDEIRTVVERVNEEVRLERLGKG